MRSAPAAAAALLREPWLRKGAVVDADDITVELPQGGEESSARPHCRRRFARDATVALTVGDGHGVEAMAVGEHVAPAGVAVDTKRTVPPNFEMAFRSEMSLLHPFKTPARLRQEQMNSPSFSGRAP